MAKKEVIEEESSVVVGAHFYANVDLFLECLVCMFHILLYVMTDCDLVSVLVAFTTTLQT